MATSLAQALALLAPASLAVAALSSFASPSGVIVVDASGGGDHLTIQAAIDAAQEADILLVRPGVYPSFSLSAKSLSIVASGPGVRVNGYASIVGIDLARSVHVSGLEIQAPYSAPPAFGIFDSTGDVRLQDCILSSVGPNYEEDGPVSVLRLRDARRVVLVDCVAVGADGALGEGIGYPGQSGLILERSKAAVHGCEFRGGRGGNATPIFGYCDGGNGGSAVLVLGTSELYASGGSFIRGPAGLGCSVDGAPGLSILVDGSSHADLLGVALTGGTAGSPTVLPGAARRLQAPTSGVEGTLATLLLSGQSGDRVYLLAAERPGFRLLLPALTGYLLVDPPLHGARYLGTIPSGGQLSLSIPLSKLEPDQLSRRLHLQALFRSTSGQSIASSWRGLQYLDRLFHDCLSGYDPGGSFDDCDGNGIPDDCDILLGTYVDCDGNEVPDVCDARFSDLSPVLSPIGFDSPQSWTFSAPPLALGPVSIRVRAVADLAQQNQRIRVRVNNVELGSIFSQGGSHCPPTPDVAELTVPAATFNSIVNGGDAVVLLLPSSTVDSQACTNPGSWAQIELSYFVPTPYADCNGDGIPDQCATYADCNGNGIDDACEIASGSSTDVDGNGVPDDCQQSPVLYVDASQAGAEDGLSWATAFRDLHEALALAQVQTSPVVQIWVAGGEYRPAPPGGPRAKSFVVPARVALYGGFAGYETELGQRDVQANPTILSGDLNGDDGPGFVQNDENSFHVVVLTPQADVRLDGFTIRGGNADGLESPHRWGAGVLVLASGPLVADCTFTSNSASHYGGAAYLSGNLSVQSSRFLGNRARTAYGGAIYSTGGSLDLLDCVFLGNRADGGQGGAVRMSSGTLHGCRFEQNVATSDGGGLYASGTVSVVDCHFERNVGSSGGGAFVSGSSSADLRFQRSTFVENVATSNGGGVLMSAGYVDACRFLGNSAGANGGGLRSSGNVTWVNCLFHDNRAQRGAGAYVASGSGSQRLISSCTFTRNAATVEGGGVFVNLNGLLVRNSILWGNGGGPNVERAQIAHSSSQPPSLSHCVLEGLNLHAGNANIDANPAFVDPQGADAIPGTLDDDFRLLSGSPAVDSGSNALLPTDLFDQDGDGDVLEPWPFDHDGAPRIVDDPGTPDTGPGPSPHVDRGVYERQ